MAATMMTLSGSAVAAPATRLSSNAAFGSSEVQQQQRIVRPSAKASKVVAARVCSNDEDRSAKKPQMLVALVAAVALNGAPVWPAHAGLFGGDAKVESGATAPDSPAATRGPAPTGTPPGEPGKSSGSRVAEKARDAVETGIDVNIDPMKTKIRDINPLKDTLNPAASDAN